MYHIKDDRRSIRSSEMLYDGLAKLMQEKAFTAITVKDLVEVAQVGRTTFYRNFDDIEDILRLRCDQTIEGMIQYILQNRQNNQNTNQLDLLKPVLHYFDTRSEIIELLLKAKRIDILRTAFRTQVEQFKPQFALLQNIPEDYIEYGITIRTGIIISILVHWIEHGKQQSPDELAGGLEQMFEQPASILDIVALQA